MLKIGDYIIENFNYNINQSYAILVFEWTNSIESLLNLFLNNNCKFELDNNIYTEYNIISDINKNFENNSNQCTITLKCSQPLQDAFNIVLGQKANSSYQEIVACRKDIEHLISYLPLDELSKVRWMIPDCYINTAYKAEDIVVESGQIRKCKFDCFNGEDFDESNWWLLKDGQWIDYIEDNQEEE